MSKLNWIEESRVITLPAVVTLETLPELIKSSKSLELPVLKADFSQVTQVDSAILALLLTWSKNTGQALVVMSAPSELLTLIQLYDLEDVIKVA